eukprot:TRINITY_DN6033_c0_g1_i7.p1 TRINITY_DN6033_c0_g1~~TRINITY_DN6033_c0_g1_i7.p1  ORF type:complete len:346 (+),score=182.21 TRINITY_DN6033_c0_g1_i7:76-1038(+)
MFPGQQPPPYQPYPPQPQPQQYSNQQPPSYQPYPPQSQPQQYPNQQPPSYQPYPPQSQHQQYSNQQPPSYQPYPPQSQPQQYPNQQPPSYQPYPPQSQPQQYPNQQPPNNGFFGSTMPPAGGMFDIFNTGVGAPSPYSTFPNAPGGVGAPPFNSDPYTRGLNQYPSPYGGPPPSTGGYNHTGPGGYGGPPPPGGYNHTGPSGYGYSYTVTETIYLKDQGVPVSNPGATHNANPYNSYDFKKAAQVDFKNMDASKASGVSFFGFVKRKLHRNYIIILDKSGSMAGSLWAQAKKGGYGGPPPPGGYNHTGSVRITCSFLLFC